MAKRGIFGVILMTLGPETSTTLLGRIASGDGVGFAEFERRYAPMIVTLGRLRRLNDRECSELVQEALLVFFRKGDRFRFDPARGRFRTFLGKVVRDAATDILRRRSGASVPEAAEDAADTAPPPDLAADRALLQMMRDDAMEQLLELLRRRVTPDTYRIFEHYVLKQHSTDEPLDGECIGRNRIYKAKQRCLAILREEGGKMCENDPELRFCLE